MQTKVQHGKPELWIRLVQAVAVAGLCFSVAFSLCLYRMEVQITDDVARAQEELLAAKKRCVMASVETVPLTSQEISRITGQADVLNRILYGGIVFTSKKASLLDGGLNTLPGDTL